MTILKNTIFKYNLDLYISLLVVIALHIIVWDYYFLTDLKGDQLAYWSHADLIYRSLSNISNSNFGVLEPVFPLIMAFLWMIFSQSVTVVVIYHLAIYLILISILFFWSKGFFEKRIWALVLLFLFITNYKYIFYNFLIMRESSTIFLITLSVVTFFYAINRDGRKWPIVFGIVAGCLILLDNRYIFYVPFFFLYWIIFYFKQKQNRKKFALGLLSFILILAPWTIRQTLVENIPLPLSTFRIASIVHIFDEDEFEKNWKHLRGEETMTEEEKEKQYYTSQNLTKAQYEAMKKNKIRGFVPTFWFRIKDCWRFYNNKHYIRAGDDNRVTGPWSLQQNLNELLHTGLLLPFLFAAIYFSIKRREYFITFLIFLVAWHTLFHGFMGVLMRYRYHFMPVFTIVSIYGIKETFSYIHERMARRG